jgi:tetratricopeptide (TPR) repeat protein
MDGLSNAELKRRDALTPEVLRRSGTERGTLGQEVAAVGLLREKMTQDPGDYLWPLLLGRQLMGMRRYAPAIAAFEHAVRVDENDIRAYFGAGHAYFQAAEALQRLGDAATDDTAPAGMTLDNLFQEALRNFRRAQELAEKNERDELATAVATVQRAVARKAGRL